MCIFLAIRSANLKRQYHANEFQKVYRDTGLTNCIANRQIDPYGRGCYFNCKYCYGKAVMIHRGRWHPDNPGVAKIETIAQTIKEEFPSGSVCRIGGLTDPFQPIEKLHRMTYKTIKLLNRKKVHYLVVTKGTMVADKEYLDLYDPELAHFQISLTSTDNDFLKKISPRVPTFEQTKKTIETLYENGFDTIIRASPFFYEHMDYDKLNSIRCDKINIEFLYINKNINSFIKKVMDTSEYNFSGEEAKGYAIYTLPIEKQLKEIEKITGFKELNMCNGFPHLKEYFKEHVNCNKEFCCNLRGVTKENAVGIQKFENKI